MTLAQAMEETTWENAFLSSEQLRKFSQFLSGETIRSFLGIVNHNNLDRSTFLDLFEKAKEMNLYDLSALKNKGENLLFFSKEYRGVDKKLHITSSFLNHEYFPEEDAEEILDSSESNDLIAFFFSNSQHEKLIEFYDSFIEKEIRSNDNPKIFESYYLCAILGNPKCPKEFIRRKIKEYGPISRMSKEVLKRFLGNPNTPVEFLAKAEKYFVQYQDIFLRNKVIPSKIVNSIVLKKWEDAGAQVFGHPNISFDTLNKIFFEFIDKAKNNDDTKIKIGAFLTSFLSHPNVPKNILDMYFDFYPIIVLSNHSFDDWEKVESFLENHLIKSDREWKNKIFSILVNRLDMPRSVAEKVESLYGVEDIPIAWVRHPKCSRNFVECMKECYEYQEDHSLLKRIDYNYSENPALSLADIIKFWAEKERPYGLFANPVFGRLPGLVRNMIVESFYGKLKEIQAGEERSLGF